LAAATKARLMKIFPAVAGVRIVLALASPPMMIP
jgi:hypothetical protein